MKKTILLFFACLFCRAMFANHWTPVPGSGSSNSTTIIAVVQINGIEQTSDQLELGIFCGDQCRGSQIAEDFFITHRYLFFVNVYGENGHELTFKLYDHSIGQEFDVVSPASVVFTDDGYGTPIEPYELNFISNENVTQITQLVAGWNWFSTYVDITLNDLKAALSEALPDVQIVIKGKNNTTTYDPVRHRWNGNLPWNASLMYEIKAASDCQITLQGEPVNPADHPVSIVNGANWIAFPLQENMSLTNAFAGFATNGDAVKSKNNTAQYIRGRWVGAFTLEPGKGYIYKSAASGTRTFTFPTSAK